MATSRLMPLHTGKGRTVGQAISDIIDYTENPQKTDGGRLITSWQCDSRIADAEFLFTKNQYIQKTGRVRGEDEEKMEAAIAELVKGKTLFVIAHKLPAIMNADQICVIEHGKLAATGTHAELLATCEEYKKLWKASQDSAEWKVNAVKEGK